MFSSFDSIFIFTSQTPDVIMAGDHSMRLSTIEIQNDVIYHHEGMLTTEFPHQTYSLQWFV